MYVPLVPGACLWLLWRRYRSERQKAKILNFSIAYGKTPFGLAKDWGVTVKEAEAMLEAWYGPATLPTRPPCLQALTLLSPCHKRHGPWSPKVAGDLCLATLTERQGVARVSRSRGRDHHLHLHLGHDHGRRST